jgi:glycosyltransferase involved in cell wall biosynthesis
MRLSILVCTVLERHSVFKELMAEFYRQIDVLPIEFLYEMDNKQISVGAKRQKLLERATGDYIVFFDDDDFPEPYYVMEILWALASKPDCLGYLIKMTTNSEREQVCCHSLRYPEWKDNVDGYDYVRNVTHFNVVRRDLALQVGFKDKRFGEDKLYSDAVTKLCKTEVFIDKVMFHYRYSNKVPHRKKYGIR